MRKTGYYERLGAIQYFVPSPLPPQDPPLKLDQAGMALYGDAMHQLAKLDEKARQLPDVHRFLKAFVIKEALLTSAIEGIHTTLLDVFMQPLLGKKANKATQLVINYTKALDVALGMIKKENLPISSRVIKKAHEVLMEIGEGDKADPGNFRKQAVRVGNLIPPPANLVPQLMADLERYINENADLPLIKAGLAHVQFETIHPFLDGNGRIGRLLIVLILIENGLLSLPILYPSYYFKKRHMEYYQRLDGVRTAGDFEGWVTYYLTAIKESSIDAYARIEDIEKLKQTSEKKIDQFIKKTYKTTPKGRTDKMLQTRHSALAVLFSFPVISATKLSKQLKISFNNANQIITDFEDLELLIEETGQTRGKLFSFLPYLEILDREY